MPTTTPSLLYPEIKPNRTGFLLVDEIHRLYWEISGNPDGEPILFLHGGPGSRTDPKHRQYFDPKRYQIILFDQRGSGQSLPFASLEKNTTWDLIEDINQLLNHLNIKQVTLFGGSWGSTLALTYAISHPTRVKSMILRGIFLGTKKEAEWFYQNGANHFYPKEWKQFRDHLQKEDHHDLLSGYYKKLTSTNDQVRKDAAMEWARWELTCCCLDYSPEIITQILAEFPPDAIARIEAHYFMNKCFFPEDDWIINRSNAIKNIPTHIVQGRYDLVCPPINAYRLSEKLNSCNIHFTQLAGHSSSEPETLNTLLKVTNLSSFLD
ncbi:prolyl aminopeptidase [Chlamydiales bacterium]|nr:prolyl aminopeptidase [Chlamydiales bacterium]